MASKPEGLEDRNKETETIKKERKLMKNRKLFAAALAATLAVSAFGTTVMAAEGVTNFTYTPGTSGPTDPVNPGDEETSENNWMVSYPRQITLMDNNESDLANASTKGQKLEFKVKQRVAGADGSDKVTAGNVGTGIVVAAGQGTAASWASGTDITMKGTKKDTNTVIMQIANAESSSFVQPAGTLMTLTNTTDNDQAFAVIKKDEVKKAVEGETYTVDVKFTFTRG